MFVYTDVMEGVYVGANGDDHLFSVRYRKSAMRAWKLEIFVLGFRLIGLSKQEVSYQYSGDSFRIFT